MLNFKYLMSVQLDSAKAWKNILGYKSMIIFFPWLQ